MAFLGDKTLIDTAAALRAHAFEKSAARIASAVLTPFQEKLASDTPTLAMIKKDATLLLHFAKP